MPNQILPILTWTAGNNARKSRSSFWYLMWFLALALCVAYGWWSKSILTIVTFVLMFFAIWALSFTANQKVSYKILKTGIAVGETIYPYHVIKKFWIIYKPGEVKTLNFETTAYLNNKIALPLGNTDPLIVKNALSKFIAEDLERDESVSELLARKLKL